MNFLGGQARKLVMRGNVNPGVTNPYAVEVGWYHANSKSFLFDTTICGELPSTLLYNVGKTVSKTTQTYIYIYIYIWHCFTYINDFWAIFGGPPYHIHRQEIQPFSEASRRLGALLVFMA